MAARPREGLKGVPADPGIAHKPCGVHQIEQQECGCVLVLKDRVTGNVRDKVIEQHAIKRVGRDGSCRA